MTKYERHYKRRNTAGIILLVVVFHLVLYGNATKESNKLIVEAQSKPPEVQVVEKVVYEVPDTPEEYIIYKFGEVDGKRGIKMLRECENKDLGLTRINWNRNGTWDYGLWQINQVHGYSQSELSDFKFNTDVAYRIYLRAGKSFSPWTCSYIIGETPFYMK